MDEKKDRTGTVSGGCYELGEILATSKRKGEQSGTGIFGRSAEIAIENDYQAETNPSLLGIAALRTLDCDWFDSGDENAYIEILLKNHPKKLTRKQIEAEAEKIRARDKFQRPDILTADGARLILMNKIITRGRYEFYEIKPDSKTGLDDGEEKLRNIPKLYRRLGLPYQPGDFYPAVNPKEVRLIQNRVFAQLVKALMKRLGLERVKVYLTVRRDQKGLLLYKTCIEIETQDKRKQQALAKAVAKNIYASHVVCHAPERFQKQVAAELDTQLGDYSYQGDKIPVVHCSFRALEGLKPYQAAIEQAINMRGLGLPGEEYLICCDDDFYWRVLAPRTPDYLGEIWAKFLQNPFVRAGYQEGSSAWQKWEPVILRGSPGAQLLKQMYPELKEFANQVIDWMLRNPEKTVAIVLVGMVIAACVVGLVWAEVAGLGALAVEGAITESTAIPAVGVTGRFAVGAPLAGQMFSGGAAAGTSLLTAEQVAAQIGVGVAANDVALTAAAIARLAAPAAELVVPAAAAAFVLMSNVTTAYAQTTPNAKPQPSDPVVAQGFSHLFMARARNVPTAPGMRPPLPGDRINHTDYAELQPDVISLQDRPRVEVRLVGRVKLS
jgi:hypothetical protein